LYKVTLNGNYNIYVKDLNFEFTPIKTVKTFSDEEFENSTDIKVFLGEYLTATKVGNEKQAKKVAEKAEKKVSSDIKEVPVKAKNVEEETTVINATNASKTSSADKPKENKKTLVEEKNGEKDDDVVDATGASSTSSKETKSDVKSDVVVADGASKTGAKNTTKTNKTLTKKTTSTTKKTTTRKSSK